MAALPRPCLVESILFTSRPQTTFFSAPGRAPARAAGRGGRHPRATAHALSFRFRVGNQGRAHSSKVQLDVRNSGFGRASPRAAPRAPDASAFSHSHVAAGERVSPRAHASSHSHSTGSCLFFTVRFYFTRTKRTFGPHNIPKPGSKLESSPRHVHTYICHARLQGPGVQGASRVEPSDGSMRGQRPGGGGREGGEARSAPHALRSQEQPQDQSQYSWSWGCSWGCAPDRYSSATTTRKAADCRK